MQDQKQQTNNIDLEDLPDFIPWSQLDDGSAGLLPFVYGVLSALVFLGSALLSFMLLNPAFILVGALVSLMLFAVGSIVKELRLAHARQAFISALLEYYILNGSKKQGA